MVEDITVTPFFKRHRGHMPATLKLHAEIDEEDDFIVLESCIQGYEEEDVEVSATVNSIDVTLILEKGDEGDVKFHNSYVTPVPIDPDNIKVEHRDGVLTVKAPKK